jgi:hypothetical protein
LLAQPWAVDATSAVLGHLLTVDDAAFDSVADKCLIDILPLPEIFDRPWANLEQRTAWVGIYSDALRGLPRTSSLTMLTSKKYWNPAVVTWLGTRPCSSSRTSIASVFPDHGWRATMQRSSDAEFSASRI